MLKIETFYKPIQPDTSDDLKGALTYHEYPVSKDLKNFIHCFWTLSTSKSSNIKKASYRIIPDGCFDLLIDCQSNDGLLASTTSNTYSIVGFDETVNFFGIRFLPACIHYFFPFQLSEFVNTIIPSKEIFDKSLAELEDLILSAEDVPTRLKNAENFLRKQIKNEVPDKRFLNALDKILKADGNIHIEKEASEYISSRHLRRLFKHYIGFTPKVFSRIIRFQTNLEFMLKHHEKDYIHPNSSYYDQSHFINEFKKFYGLTPTEFLKK